MHTAKDTFPNILPMRGQVAVCRQLLQAGEEHSTDSGRVSLFMFGSLIPKKGRVGEFFGFAFKFNVCNADSCWVVSPAFP